MGGPAHAPAASNVVVVLTVFLNHAHAAVVRALSAHPRAAATILSSLSQAQHAAHPEVPFGRDAFTHYARLLREVCPLPPPNPNDRRVGVL